MQTDNKTVVVLCLLWKHFEERCKDTSFDFLLGRKDQEVRGQGITRKKTALQTDGLNTNSIMMLALMVALISIWPLILIQFLKIE